MKDHLENAVVRGIRAALAAVLALALALPVGGLTTLSAFADEPAQNAAEATPGDADGNAADDAGDAGVASDAENGAADAASSNAAAAQALTAQADGEGGTARVVDGFSFGVISDPHYFPAEYQGTRAEAYQNQTSGDLRLMGENEALTTAAVDQMLADSEDGSRPLPKVLLVTGDLTSEGEKAGHEGFAAQMKRLQNAGVTVLVIPGNHDLYNYDAMTFQSDAQVKDGGSGSLWTTEADFRSIYASMGYDAQATIEASKGTIDSIEYFKSVESGGVANCQGGLSYVAKTASGVAFIMVDSEVYSPDWNGRDKAWGQGAGMMSNDLLEWAKTQAGQLNDEGYTVIAGIHHPVLEHQATAETEFITDRVDVDNGDGTRSTDNSHYIATQLADAGIHYVFSGHMHENDVASYTTAKGNVIYDMETGGLCAYPAPYRYANVSTTDEGEIALDLWSVGVEQAAMNQRLDAPNGDVTDDAKVDVKEYMKDAMYGDENAEDESFITRLVMRYAARYLDQLVDIPAALQNIAGLDLYDTLFDALPGLLSGGADVDLGDLGAIHISWNDTGEFNTSGVNLDPSGTAGLLSSFTIRNEDIEEEVQSVLDQIEANYIANGRLESEISKLLENVGDVNLLNPENPNDQSGSCYTLRQLLQDMFQRHNSGADKEPMPEGMRQALDNFKNSSILQNKVQDILDNTLIPLINEVLGTTTIDANNLFGRNTLWHTAVQAILGSDNPSIATVLDKFGLDLFGEGGLVTGLLNQYLTASVYQQIGGLVVAMVTGFAGDADTLDDVVDGEAVQLKATMNPAPNPTVENGALPDQVSVSLDSDNTATSRQFSWYTSTEVDGSDVQMLPAAGIADADAAEEAMNAGTDVTEESSSNAQEVNKAKITLNLVLVTDYEIVRMNHHTATATVPAGDFYYRVGDAEQGYWSEPVYVDGEDDPSDGYTALVVADSQGSSEADYEAYEAVLAKAEENTDNEAFALHLGDMVDDGVNENYWSWLMDPDASRAVATMPVAGNHEARQDDAQLSNAIAAHYNVDIPDQDTSTGLYYSFVYGDATYIVLNTNDSDVAVSEAQRAWAASVADSADTTWKILVTHKAPYSKGSHQNDSDVLALRSWLSNFTTQHGIDLVLSGHDHTYMRTPSLTNGIEASVTTQTVTDSAGNPYEAQLNPAGTTFVIPSTSGTKFYDVVENDLPTAKSGQPYQPIYSTLSIEGDTLFWRSYTVSGDEATLYDSFAITKNNNLTAAEKVMQMIDALPDPNSGSDAVLATKADINEARAAYDELTDDEKPQVSNLSKLEQLEQLIVVYEDIAGKDTVDLSTGIYYDGADDDEGQRRAAFKDAIANPNVGTIVLPGDWSTAIGEYSGNTLNNQYYEVKHNVVIKAAAGSQGFADLRRCGFIVKDGATLVLDDVKLQAWQKKPLIGSTTPMNMIRVENGTLIANGNTSVLVNRDNGSTDGFKDESWRGHAAIVGNPDVSSAAGERAVYLNLSDSGIISGLRDSVVQHTDSSSENDRVYLNGGSYNTIYDGNSSVNLSCQLEINGGAFTKVTSNKDLVVNGGEFNGSSVDYPIRMNGGNLYVKNIGSIVAGTTGKAFHVAGELHIADAALQKLEGTSLDLSAGAATSEGWPLTATATGLGENRDGTIFAVGQQITSMQGMAANTQGGLKTQASGSTLSAMAQLAADQTAYAYAKYHAASGSVLASCVDGNTDGLYAYSGYTMLANPRAELSLAADPGAIVAWDQEEPPSVQLRAGIEPNDATKFVSWESSNGDIATVDENGKAAFKTAGQVTVTAKHVTTGAKATITLSAVKASMEGSEIYDPNAEDGQRYGLNLAAGDISLNALPEGYAVEWTLNEGAAATVAPDAGDPLAATLMRTDNAASTVTLTATLTKDGEPTGVAASKEIQIREIVAGPTDEQVQSLVEVTVSDSNKAENHGDLTSDLLANTTGTTDSYSISSPYFVDNAWKADVTVHAARYVSAYNEGEQAAGEEHELDGADSAKVTLVRSADGAWSVEEGSTNPVAFTVKCDATVVAKDEIAITPDKDNTAYVYDGLGHGFAFSKSPNDSLEGFVVEYRPARSADDVTWTTDVPVNAGTYDVRVTRAEDETYATFEQTFEGGVVIAKAKLAMPAVIYMAGEEPGSVAVLLQNGDADMYYWSESDDKSDPVEAESARFEVTEPGTYYVWGAGDDNHEDSDVVTTTIVKVSFDDNDGIVGADESEGAVFTKGTAEVLLPKDQCLDSWGGLPEVEWAGHEFLGWQLPGGKELTKLTAIVESATATAQWGVDAAGLTAYVVFDADGGTFSDGSSSATVEVPLTSAADYVPIGDMPADPTRTGYDFAGWFYTDPLTQQEEAFDPERTEVAGSMNVYAKWAEKRAIAITPDEGNVKYVYDGEGKPFAFGKSADVEGFVVEYRPAGSAGDVTWTPDVPVNAGTYDVRVARAEDETYAAFEQTFKGGVVIAKADQAAPALEVTPGVDEATIKIEGAEGAHVAAAYEWSAAEDFSNAQTIEGDSFEATASGTYYVRAVADANHNAGAPANVTLAMVTFDAAGGTLSGNATWLLETGTSVGDANLPTATWNGHGFEGWALADGTAFDGSSVVNGDLEVAAQWSVGAETLAPAAPTGAYVAERLQGVSVALHGVNEINSANDGGAHPDVTFAASGDNVQPLIADSFQIGQPAETDGVWTVSVVLDAQKYLEAYAQMGDPAYGAHYFADPDEDGQESFTLAYDKTSRTWKLAEGQQAGYTFDITCLTLRPAELVKYTGGIDGGEVHFPDARVVDGQGNVYTIDQLNALLDEGTTARVAYFDGDGAELADDTVPGVYEARIVVDAATALLARVADQDAEDSVDVNVDGNVYRFSLEPSTLTIRNASDDAAAESGALDVELIAADAGSSDITAAVNAASGGVAAQLPKGTRIFVNDRESGELTGEELAGVRLFSDELLGADDSDGVDRLADLKARAAQEGYEIADEASDFQYLDLVDAGQSNLWVSSTEGATIYWKVPEGADPDSLRVLHFADLHREYGVNAADLQQQIAACAVEEMPLDTTHVADGYVSFPVERAGFSPFVLTWDAAEPDNPDQPVHMATVTFDANGGQLPAGAPASVEVTAGGTVAALPEPVRAGYTFAGWTDASGGRFTSETVVSGSMTVVAQWTANVYPVTLDPQGGAFGDPSQATIRATFGATVGQLPQPSRDGYEFVGWFTQQQGGEQVTASTVYATAASSTYYAQWKTLPAAQAAVTLDANGGAFADGTATAQVMLADGAVLHRSDLPQPSRAGYLLAGWCLDAALTQPVLFADDELAPGKQPTVATEGLVLYAKWLGDLSGGASFSFANVQQAYTGAPVPAVPTFGSGFPAAEQARVKVLYHPAQAGADAWSDQAPRNVGSYDVRFVYGGSDAYAPFEKDYPAGIVIAKATLTQTGLVASPAEVKEGMKLADISLTGATVTSSETGTAVEGAWSWVDADGAVDESGMYQAVFVPTDTANYDLLYVEVPLTVQADEPDQPGSGDEPIDPDRPGSDDKPSNPDEPGSGDEPTDPDEPGTSPDQPGSGELGTGGDSDSGVGAGSDNSNGRNQVKLVATGDPIAGVLVGLGAVLIAALVTCLAALRNSGRKN